MVDGNPDLVRDKDLQEVESGDHKTRSLEELEDSSSQQIKEILLPFLEDSSHMTELA